MEYEHTNWNRLELDVVGFEPGLTDLHHDELLRFVFCLHPRSTLPKTKIALSPARMTQARKVLNPHTRDALNPEYVPIYLKAAR